MISCLAAVRRWGWLATLTFLMSWAAQAQTLPNWTNVQAGTTGARIATDAQSNSLVAGTVAGVGIQLTKLSPAGAMLWQRSLPAAGTTARATSVAVDAGGNALLTGFLMNTSGYVDGGVVARFDAAGNLLWQDVQPGQYSPALHAVLDGNGGSYVLGRRMPGTVPEATITRYSATGTRLWVQTWGAAYVSPTDAMVLMPSGLLAVAGQAAYTGSTMPMVVVALLDAAGNVAWNSTSLSSESEPGVAVTGQGELVVVGSQYNGFFIIKFNTGFGPAWARNFPVRGYAMRAAVDSAGNVVVSGVTDTNTSTLQSVQYGWLTMKLDSAGNQLWTHTLKSNATGLTSIKPAALALGSDGAVYLNGENYVALADGSKSYGFSTLKLAPNGTQAWSSFTPVPSSVPITSTGLKLSGDGGVLSLASYSQTVQRFAQSGLANQAPVAMASASPSAGPAPLAVQFSASGSSDADGQIASYQWDFGDGTGSSLANPSHTYALGSYTARLTVTDTLGASSAPASVVVSANAVAPAQPTALTPASGAVVGGSTLQATVSVSTTSGATVLLNSSNTSVARMPASVVIPVGATSASFTITTYGVRRDTTVSLSASANGRTVSKSLLVKRR